MQAQAAALSEAPFFSFPSLLPSLPPSLPPLPVIPVKGCSMSPSTIDAVALA
jgi:hypothetical protein